MHPATPDSPLLPTLAPPYSSPLGVQHTAVEAPGNAKLESTISSEAEASLYSSSHTFQQACCCCSCFLNPITAPTSASTHRASRPVWKRLDTVRNRSQQI